MFIGLQLQVVVLEPLIYLEPSFILWNTSVIANFCVVVLRHPNLERRVGFDSIIKGIYIYIPIMAVYTPSKHYIHTIYHRSIYPYQGSIQPYQSSILPYQGSIHPYQGSICPYQSSIYPYQGSIYPHGGNVYSYWGCLGLKTLVTSFSAIKKKKAICVLLSYIPPPPFLCSPIPWLFLGWVFIVQTTLSRYFFTGMARG